MSAIPLSVKPYGSPINPALYPTLSVLLSLVGLLFFAWFLVYEVTTTSRQKRSIYKELLLALVSSIFLGFATLFTLLWVGVYV